MRLLAFNKLNHISITVPETAIKAVVVMPKSSRVILQLGGLGDRQVWLDEERILDDVSRKGTIAIRRRQLNYFLYNKDLYTDVPITAMAGLETSSSRSAKTIDFGSEPPPPAVTSPVIN